LKKDHGEIVFLAQILLFFNNCKGEAVLPGDKQGHIAPTNLGW